jgi:hypothetical protein
MRLKKRDPHSPEVIDEVVEMFRKMTPEEALNFITYRPPGVEETDMTGALRNGHASSDAEAK